MQNIPWKASQLDVLENFEKQNLNFKSFFSNDCSTLVLSLLFETLLIFKECFYWYKNFNINEINLCYSIIQFLPITKINIF